MPKWSFKFKFCLVYSTSIMIQVSQHKFIRLDDRFLGSLRVFTQYGGMCISQKNLNPDEIRSQDPWILKCMCISKTHVFIYTKSNSLGSSHFKVISFCLFTPFRKWLTEGFVELATTRLYLSIFRLCQVES